jgi:hypothetical protein
LEYHGVHDYEGKTYENISRMIMVLVMQDFSVIFRTCGNPASLAEIAKEAVYPRHVVGLFQVEKD